MKKLIVILLLLAAPAFAASWTVTTTTGQDTRATRELNRLNKATCASVGLGANCTQVNARIAYCAQPLAIVRNTVPCTVNGISSGTLVIYGTVGEYLDKVVVGANAAALKAKQDAEDLNSFGTWRQTATQGQKDAVCASAGLPAGCLP